MQTDSLPGFKETITIKVTSSIKIDTDELDFVRISSGNSNIAYSGDFKFSLEKQLSEAGFEVYSETENCTTIANANEATVRRFLLSISIS